MEKEEILFDEFGNPLNVSESESSSDESEVESISDEDNGEVQEQRQIILPEEKEHFQSLDSAFGSAVETIVATEDAMDVDEPIIAPQVKHKFRLEEENIPKTTYEKEYLWDFSNVPERIRNVAICGNIHSGKTSLIDLMINQTHFFYDNSKRQKRAHKYTDDHILESKRGMTIKSKIMTLLLPNDKASSTMVNFIDTPGHISFSDELTVSLRLCDSIMLCVDVIEGVNKNVELVIEQALRNNTNIVLVLNKIDRLILELCLPPLDAFYKLRRLIESVNLVINSISGNEQTLRLSPELGNVCFASNLFGCIFSLESFTKMYFAKHNLGNLNFSKIDAFSKRLWGDFYYENKKFTTKPNNKIASATKRTFIQFILDPLYKLATRIVSLDPPELKIFLQEQFKMNFSVNQLKLNSKALMKLIFNEFFGYPSPPLVEILNLQTPSPVENADQKFQYLFSNVEDETIKEHVLKCDPAGPLVAYVTKLTDTSDSEHFYAQVRVLSGSIEAGKSLRLLGDNFSDEYMEHTKVQKIKKCYLSCGRYKISVPTLRAGSIGLISGPNIDSFISKTASIYDLSFEDLSSLPTLRSYDEISEPVYKVAIQPQNPKDLNKFTEGLKKLTRSYIGCQINVDESGQHTVLGFGEIYLDCALHDLRQLYGHIQINVSDPMVRFSETVDNLSSVKLVTKSNNGKNRITIIAEPLTEQLSYDLESGKLDFSRETDRNFAKLLRTVYKWDSLASRSVWGVGPNNRGSALLCDDTLADEVDKDLLLSLKSYILQGFNWAASEGPLCNENLRGVKFRIIDAQFAGEEIDRNGTQIIQMVKKACHAAILVSGPRMMEPTFNVEVMCWNDVSDVFEKLLIKRRGSILNKIPIEGTPLSKVYGSVPVIESFGLETDLRLITRGKAFPQMTTSKWEIVPGDPLDETAFIPLIKPAPIKSLSRDFMIKTRKRKELSDRVTLKSYVDEETWDMLRELGVFG